VNQLLATDTMWIVCPCVEDIA